MTVGDEFLPEIGGISTNPYATGPARLEIGAPPVFGLLAGVVASSEYNDSRRARGSRDANLTAVSLNLLTRT